MTILRSVGEFSAVYMRSFRGVELEVRQIEVFGFVETDANGSFALPLVLNERGQAVNAEFWRSVEDDPPFEFVGVVRGCPDFLEMYAAFWWVCRVQKNEDDDLNNIQPEDLVGPMAPNLLGLSKFESRRFFGVFKSRVLAEAKERAAIADAKAEASK